MTLRGLFVVYRGRVLAVGHARAESDVQVGWESVRAEEMTPLG